MTVAASRALDCAEPAFPHATPYGLRRFRRCKISLHLLLANRLHQASMIFLYLISVLFCPLRQCFIENRGISAVTYDARGITSPRMSACENRPTPPGIEVERHARKVLNGN